MKTAPIDLHKDAPFNAYLYGPTMQSSHPDPEKVPCLAPLAPLSFRFPGSSSYPEGVDVLPWHLEHSAHTCIEAAYGRNVTLATELKTVVYFRHWNHISRPTETYVFHLPGNRYVDLDRLGIGDARMRRRAFKDYAGSLNPFSVFEFFKDIRVFVCEFVLRSAGRFTTNDGTPLGTLVVSPDSLARAFRYVPFRSVDHLPAGRQACET